MINDHERAALGSSENQRLVPICKVPFFGKKMCLLRYSYEYPLGQHASCFVITPKQPFSYNRNRPRKRSRQRKFSCLFSSGLQLNICSLPSCLQFTIGSRMRKYINNITTPIPMQSKENYKIQSFLKVVIFRELHSK